MKDQDQNGAGKRYLLGLRVASNAKDEMLEVDDVVRAHEDGPHASREARGV